MPLSAFAASDDPRFSVLIAADEQGVIPSVREATRMALPKLWDRILVSDSRAQASDGMQATSFLQRVIPGRDGVLVVFNPQRVWPYLDSAGLAYIKEPPRINLAIQMSNQNDQSMPRTAAALQAYASESAANVGIVLDHSAPSLKLQWRWLDTSQVYLTIRSSQLLNDYTETRHLQPGDPLLQLQAWLNDMLRRIRDAHVQQEHVIAELPADPYASRIEFILTIEQAAALPEQVILEQAFRRNGKVKKLLPVFLSATTRQYQVLLHDRDDAWIPDWFHRRGMQATPTVDGWLVWGR